PYPLRTQEEELLARLVVSGSRSGVGLAVALQRGSGVGIGLLQLDAPIAQLIERDGAAGHGTAHEVAGRQHLNFAVEIFELGFALEANVAFETVHQGRVTRLMIEFRSVTIASPRGGGQPAYSNVPCFSSRARARF